jgi:CHAD domain-containing protein
MAALLAGAGARRAAAYAAVAPLLDGPAFRELALRLAVLVQARPWQATAGEAAAGLPVDTAAFGAEVLARRMRRLVRDAGDFASQPEAALHRLRLRAKRLRYAAESAVPVLGEPAAELAESCALVQDALGEQHDSTVMRALLGVLATEAVTAGEGHGTFGELQSREEDRAVASENRSELALRVLAARNRRRWLRQDPTTRTGTTTASP